MNRHPLGAKTKSRCWHRQRVYDGWGKAHCGQHRQALPRPTW